MICEVGEYYCWAAVKQTPLPSPLFFADHGQLVNSKGLVVCNGALFIV